MKTPSKAWKVTGSAIHSANASCIMRAPDIHSAEIRAKRKGIFRARSVGLALTPTEQRQDRQLAIKAWRAMRKEA